MIVIVGNAGMLIKTAGILRELDYRKIGYQYINLGQHGKRMSELNEIFGLKPFDINLSEYYDLTSIKEIVKWFIEQLWNHKSILNKDGPLIIQGDTLSTLLGCIIGKLHKLKIAHIEAGVRSYSIINPFPEELTRYIVSKNSDILFTPSKIAYNNLKKEKIPGIIINTNKNTVLDAIKIALNKDKNILYDDYVLVSIHRFENIFIENNMKVIINTIKKINKKIIWPLHPITKKYLKDNNIDKFENIEFLPIQDYFTFIGLMKNAIYVLTDGGGPQQECSILGTPCLLMRRRTETHDGLGSNVFLSELDEKRIDFFINSYAQFRRETVIGKVSPSKIIVDYLVKEFLL